MSDKWWLDPARLAEGLAEHKTFVALSIATGVNVSTLKTAAKRPEAFGFVKGRGLEKPAVLVDNDSASIVLPPNVDLGDIREMILHHKLDPDEWTVRDVTLNKWDAFVDGEVTPMRQVKVFLKRVVLWSQLFPAVDPKPLVFPASKPRKDGPQLWVFTSCWQAPYHDEKFHKAFCRWLNEVKPDHGVDMGDLLDLPSVSKHRDNPAYFASVQECINAGYRLLHDRRSACPDTKWRLLEGNHDERLRSELLSRAERMYGVRPGVLPGELPEDEVLSLRKLLHLERLDVEFINTPNGGNYEHSQVKVSDSLVARHGWLTGPNAGSRTVEKIGLSVIVGHTHMQGIQIVPRYEKGVLETLIGVEVGCGCEVKPDGLGYAAQPRWVQGFATACVWPNGEFTIDLARFKDGVIRWRNMEISG